MIVGAGEAVVKIMPSYVPQYQSAVRWGQSLSGAPYRTDRGPTGDLHSCGITVQGKAQDVLDAFEALTMHGFASGTDSVTLEAGEWLFGPATAITGALQTMILDEVSSLERVGFDLYRFTATLSVNSVVYASQSPTIPTIFYPDMSHTAEVDLGLSMARPYDISNGTTVIRRMVNDYAKFTFSQVMDNDTAGKFQMYIQTVNRGAVIPSANAPTIAGIDYPFGPNQAYPCDIVIKDVQFVPYTPTHWRVKVTMQKA